MAKAICAQQGGDPEGGYIHDSKGVRFVIHEWAKYEKAAIEVLRAIKQPSEGQLKAFMMDESSIDLEGENEEAGRREEIIAVWESMIEAALKE